jgi:hypothetical protein
MAIIEEFYSPGDEVTIHFFRSRLFHVKHPGNKAEAVPLPHASSRNFLSTPPQAVYDDLAGAGHSCSTGRLKVRIHTPDLANEVVKN